MNRFSRHSLPEQINGFTFVEILAAMLFMAIVLPVAVQGSLLANRVGIAAERKRAAVMLADRILNESLATETWREGDQSGDFGIEWPGYRWQLTTTSWSEDTMRQVTVRVNYTVQDRDYYESLTTLADETEEDTSS